MSGGPAQVSHGLLSYCDVQTCLRNVFDKDTGRWQREANTDEAYALFLFSHVARIDNLG